MATSDVVIRNAQLIDGTGAPGVADTTATADTTNGDTTVVDTIVVAPTDTLTGGR